MYGVSLLEKGAGVEDRADRAARADRAEEVAPSSARPAAVGGEEGGVSRRRFLKVLGVAGGGSIAATACGSSSPEKLIPYLIPVEDQIPGVATWYASTCRECPAGCGVHARVREGRAVKLEGNPTHPINRGKLCARGQAALQGLYNPDRVRGPMARNGAGTFEPISWEDAITRVGESLLVTAGLTIDEAKDNVGVRLLVEPRFLTARVTRQTGLEVPPVGAFGIE